MRTRYSGWHALRTGQLSKDNLVSPNARVQATPSRMRNKSDFGCAQRFSAASSGLFSCRLYPLKWLHCIFGNLLVDTAIFSIPKVFPRTTLTNYTAYQHARGLYDSAQSGHVE